MPELSYDNILRCVHDTVTQVRDLDGRLLGCIPRVPDEHQPPYITSTSGQNFSLMVSAQICVMCDPRTHDPRSLPGFVALDMQNMDVGDPLPGPDPDLPAGEDPDLGRPV